MYKASDILLASKESFTVRFNELIFVIFLVLFEFFLLYSITQLTRKNTWVLAVTALGFTVLDIYIFYMMGALAAGYKNRYELESIKIQNRIQLDHYEELNRKYAETRRMMHDIEKHITAIEKLAEDGSFSEANNYTKRLRGDLEKYKSIFECSNVILRAVLSQKISTAEAKDITVKTEIENLTLEFMEETDITSIFANLMDNAIEACEEVTNDKLISIKMCKINDIIFIDMANSYAGKLNKSDGILKTTKIGHMGYGIASIKMAVEKYNGYMTTESEDNKFISRILIPVP